MNEQEISYKKSFFIATGIITALGILSIGGFGAIERLKIYNEGRESMKKEISQILVKESRELEDYTKENPESHYLLGREDSVNYALANIRKIE